MPISCSVVLAPTAHKPIQSHTFLRLNAPTNALTHKEGVFAIMTGSLIAILHEHLQPGDGVPADIAHILQGQISSLQVVIASSSVPVFDAEMQDPVNGYRTIGSLANLKVQIETPSLSMTSPTRSQEIEAVHSSSSSKMSQFLHCWSRFGVNIETHFILILHNISPPRALSHTTFGTSSPYSSLSRTPSPLTIFDSDSSRNSLVENTEGFIFNNSPVSFPDAGLIIGARNDTIQSFLRGVEDAIWPDDVISLDDNPSMPPPQRMPTITSSIYDECSVSPALRSKAMFKNRSGPGSLLYMIQNHMAMMEVLKLLSIITTIYEPYDSHTKATFASGE